ncbi:hypothetical protein CBW16_10310 [Flavobacteriaceae bacterium JJC]|uniref:site-specific integrase n=1 Tax=Kaistella soli TaxID=2849654 RepID=UPI000B4B2EF9|nr:site-specific integrase [Kaistella soli]MBU8882373.1 site-specific integrase [Kaistella soli]OWK73144.1 hypothetical protein CBW16_10310 [Flavobacteriaceae bacterium JJC]
MATLKFILKTQREDKAGHSPLYIRVIQNRKTKFISTGIKLKASQWDQDAQKVRKNYPNSTRMNVILAQKIADAGMMVLEEEKKTKNLTANEIKKALKGEDGLKFFPYKDKVFGRLENTLSVNTMYNYKQLLKKFSEFADNQELLMKEVDVALIKDYMNYLVSERKNSGISVKTCMIPLAMIYNSAIADGLVDKNLYPFDKIKIKIKEHKRKFLNVEQFEKFKNYDGQHGRRGRVFKDMFVFAVSAGGLRFSDIACLRWEEINLTEGIIERKINKTGRTHRLKIGTTAIEILKKYWNESNNKLSFVFPAVSVAKFDRASPEDRRKLIANANVLCNIHLRTIGKNLEFPFNLHFHLSRHTFATFALNNGMRIEYVSKLMDHTKISTTQIYAKVMNDELDKAVDEFVI